MSSCSKSDRKLRADKKKVKVKMALAKKKYKKKLIYVRYPLGISQIEPQLCGKAMYGITS